MRARVPLGTGGLAGRAEDYLSERKKLGYGCERTYRWMLRRLVRAARERLGKEPEAADVVRDDLHAVTEEGKQRGYGDATQHHTARFLGLFCRWLTKRGDLALDPSSGYNVRKPERRVGYVPSRNEIKRLLLVASPERALLRLVESGGASDDGRREERVRAEAIRDQAILELLYGSGLRYHEMTSLDVRDLDLVDRTAFIRSGKGKKDRVVPLTRRSAKALARYLKESRPVLLSQETATPRAGWNNRKHHRKPAALFLAVAGGRLQAAWRDISLKPLALLACLPSPFTPHRLRHACAVHLLDSGASIVAISRLLGHASLHATEIYLSLTASSLAKVIARAHPRERGQRDDEEDADLS